MGRPTIARAARQHDMMRRLLLYVISWWCPFSVVKRENVAGRENVRVSYSCKMHKSPRGVVVIEKI